LVNQALLRGLKVHQGQGLLGFWLLQFGRGIYTTRGLFYDLRFGEQLEIPS